MKPELKLSEKLFCLSINPVSGGFWMNASATLGITLAGSVLVELMNKGIITLDNKLVHLLKPTVQSDVLHEFFMDPIRLHGKDRKIRTWISWYHMRARKIRKLFIRELMHKNVLRVEERRFLFIPYDKVFLMDRALVENLRKELEDTLLGKTEANEESVILAIMVAKTNLLRRILPDREQRKTAAAFIKKLPETPVTKAVQEAIQLMHTAAYVAATS
ncbi:MAG: GOLPH3/VPS74 family protein [Methylococcaceae bacterium]|nr:GPP34 family phosphoprotein [Prolixibacteraceae bacterium]